MIEDHINNVNRIEEFVDLLEETTIDHEGGIDGWTRLRFIQLGLQDIKAELKLLAENFEEDLPQNKAKMPALPIYDSAEVMRATSEGEDDINQDARLRLLKLTQQIPDDKLSMVVQCVSTLLEEPEEATQARG